MALVEMVPFLVLGPRRALDVALDLIMAQEGVQLMPAPPLIGAQPAAANDVPVRLSRIEHRIAELLAVLRSRASRDNNPDSHNWPSWKLEKLEEWLHNLGAAVRDTVQLDQRAAMGHEALSGFAAGLRAMAGVLEPLRTIRDTDIILLVVPVSRQPKVVELVRAIGHLAGRMPSTFEAAIGEGRMTTLLALTASPPGLSRALEASGLTHLNLPHVPGGGVTDVLRTLQERIDKAAAERDGAQRDLDELARRYRRPLEDLEIEIRHRFRRTALQRFARCTARVFLVGLWVPPHRAESVRRRLESAGAGMVVVRPPADADIGPIPLIARNVAVAAPYEMFTRWVPGAAYARVDLTPFIAVSFPTFVGLMVADVGYGAVFVALGVALRRWEATKHKESVAAVGRILVHCGLLAVAFGLLFGEVFGVRARLPLAPVLYDRRDTPLPYLFLVMGIGTGHLLTGYVIGLLAAIRERAWKRGVRLVAELAGLAGMGLLLALEVGAAPLSMRAPGVLLLAAALVLMVYAAGPTGPLEIPSALMGLISYVRLFAVGLASASLARAANQVAGLFGSAVLGILAAVLLHAISFGTSLVTPLVQAARLQLVEFGGRAARDGPPHTRDGVRSTAKHRNGNS